MFRLTQSDFGPSDSFDNFLHRDGYLGEDQHLSTEAVEMLPDQERLAYYDQKAVESKHVGDIVAEGLTIGGTAGAFGWWSGRYGMPSPLGIPADLLVAGISYGILFFNATSYGKKQLGSLGKYEKYMAGFAHGAFAHYLTYAGTRLGRSMRQSAGEGPLTNDQENPPLSIGGASVKGWSFGNGFSQQQQAA